LLLKRLEAFGFKSFADRIEIEFDKGITSIVGPNGSGKSNVTDAIRWVLGEQNIRSLRGNKAEDIIFTGSSLRKPAGAAEVSLTFDNTDGKLPLEFQEITITRRLFRSGESEFYINKARCRLKDIYTLFADTGLGKDSISVISQNKVDDILNAKPENRRLLFEECAGITKYRDRKKEAMRKLESTKQNAIRINDIIGEIEKQILESGILGQETDEEGHELLTAFAKQVRFAQFDEFVYTADIDIDGYLIQDSFYGAIHYGEGHGMTTSVDVKTLYWGFHENPDFTIPTPTETEWVDETDPEMETSFLMEFMGGIRNESN